MYVVCVFCVCMLCVCCVHISSTSYVSRGAIVPSCKSLVASYFDMHLLPSNSLSITFRQVSHAHRVLPLHLVTTPTVCAWHEGTCKWRQQQDAVRSWKPTPCRESETGRIPSHPRSRRSSREPQGCVADGSGWDRKLSLGRAPCSGARSSAIVIQYSSWSAADLQSGSRLGTGPYVSHVATTASSESPPSPRLRSRCSSSSSVLGGATVRRPGPPRPDGSF